jgi:hypothetical protein
MGQQKKCGRVEKKGKLVHEGNQKERDKSNNVFLCVVIKKLKIFLKGKKYSDVKSVVIDEFSLHEIKTIFDFFSGKNICYFKTKEKNTKNCFIFGIFFVRSEKTKFFTLA